MKDIVLITGGGRGIGAATAKLAAARGYDVVINYKSNAGTAARVVGAMPAEDVMDAIDQLQRELAIPRVAGRPIQAQEVANRKSVRPEVALCRTAPAQAGALREFHHQRDNLLTTRRTHCRSVNAPGSTRDSR